MNRESVYVALFAQLQAALVPAAGVVTLSRTLRHWVDVPAEQMPAVFLAQGNESIEEPHLGAGSRRRLFPKLYVYVKTNGAASPSSVINPILDRIEAVVNQRHPMLQVNNLGGVPGVEWARIDGNIETFEGTLGDLEVAIVPLAILVSGDVVIPSSSSSTQD